MSPISAISPINVITFSQGAIQWEGSYAVLSVKSKFERFVGQLGLLKSERARKIKNAFARYPYTHTHPTNPTNANKQMFFPYRLVGVGWSQQTSMLAQHRYSPTDR